MQTVAMTSRFLTGRSSKPGFADSESIVGNHDLLRDIVAGHLIQAVSSQELFLKLTNALIQFAEQAYTLRDVDALQEVSRVLMNLPVNAARQIGIYYYALAVKRNGLRDEAEGLLETVADNAPIRYRARAIQALGANYHDKGQLDEALRLQVEALRVASDHNAHGLRTTLLAHLEISHNKSDRGDHKGALGILETISPLVRIVARQNPLYFYFFHNELAVEFGELNRIAEAEAASSIALASPFASAYPEWAETRQELEAKRTSATPSVIAVPAPQTKPQPYLKPKRVVAFRSLIIKRTSLQRALIPIARLRAIAVRQTRRNILEQLARCIRFPRAPKPTLK